MAWLLSSIMFVLALVLLLKGSSGFVHFGAKLAKQLGVSEFTIGLTLVAIGTSLPELMNAIVSSVAHVNEFALGNILGSNMANLGLSVGLCVLLASIKVVPRLYRRELVMLVLSTVAFIVVCVDGVIGRDEGFLLALVFIGYILYITKIFDELARRVSRRELEYFITYLSEVNFAKTLRDHAKRLSKHREGIFDLLAIVGCGALLVVGSKLLVHSVVDLAALLGVTSAGIGATLVAIATTTPELSVSLASVRRGYYDLLFGNIIGSNIVNVLLIIGVGAFIHPVPVASFIAYWALPLLAVLTLIMTGVLMRRWTVPKLFGALMLLLYAGFLGVMWLA